MKDTIQNKNNSNKLVRNQKTLGTLKKITLDNKTNKIKKLTNDNKYITKSKYFYFELNTIELTFSYKEKATDSHFKQSFGYKQIYKYSLNLSEEEKELKCEEYNFGFKIFLQNKCLLLFCKNIFDLKMWIDSFQKLFAQKSSLMKKIIDDKNYNLTLNKKQESNIIFQKEQTDFVLEKVPIPDFYIKNAKKYFRDYIEYLLIKHSKLNTIIKLCADLENFHKKYADYKARINSNNMYEDWDFFWGDSNDENLFNNESENLKIPRDALVCNTLSQAKNSFIKLNNNADMFSNNNNLSSDEFENKNYKIKYNDKENLKIKNLNFSDNFQSISIVNEPKENNHNSESYENNEKMDAKENEMFSTNISDELLKNESFFNFNNDGYNKHAYSNRILPLNYPKSNKKNLEILFQDQSSIDNHYMKLPMNSLQIDIDNIDINKKNRTLIESPHFGNIAIIAQRFNKIDNMDDWRSFINK